MSDSGRMNRCCGHSTGHAIDCLGYEPAETVEQPDLDDARAWVHKKTGRFELDNPLLEVDIADFAAYAAHVLAQKTPEIRAEAVRDLINATPELAEILVLQAAKQVAKEMEAGSR